MRCCRVSARSRSTSALMPAGIGVQVVDGVSQARPALNPAPRGLEGSGADQTRARVKVTCVTPLGEEVAST